MGRLKFVFLPFIFLAMFALPVAAVPDSVAPGTALCLNAAPPDDKCEGCKERRFRAKAYDEGSALRVYAMMTGKSEKDLKSACEAGKLTIWELARRDGKLDALKAKLLEGNAAGLDALMKNGIISAEQRAKILTRIREELGKQ